MIPGPVRAVLVLFPISTESELFKEEEEKQLLASPPTIPEKLFYTKQTVGNACGKQQSNGTTDIQIVKWSASHIGCLSYLCVGTIGLIHAVLNNRDVLQLGKHDVLTIISEYFRVDCFITSGCCVDTNCLFVCSLFVTFSLDPAKFFFKYYEASSKLSPLERAVALEKDDNLEGNKQHNAMQRTQSCSVLINPLFLCVLTC